MCFFNTFLNVSGFKTFKKNLKFKKYNLGITRYIKNRRKYYLRKKTTNNIDILYIITNWTKIYKNYKQINRGVQTKLTFSYSTLPDFFTDIKYYSYFNISKKIFFNNNLFIKLRHEYKTIMKYSNYSLFHFHKIDINKLNKVLTFKNQYYLISTRDYLISYYNMLNNIFLLSTISLIKSYRRYFILLTLYFTK